MAEAYCGIEAGGGFKLDIFGWKLADFHATVFGTRFKFWDSGIFQFPKITGIDPTIIASGSEILISGEKFGNSRGPNKVHFMGGDVASGNFYLLVATDYTSWSDNEILLKAPTGIITDGVIYVTVDGRTSNEFPFLLNQSPILTTTAITNIQPSSATSGGTITSDGGLTITARGVCWSTTPSPTIADSKTTNGAGIGSFTSNFAGLTANTPYYVRAYATNSSGTGYGNEELFTTTQGQEPVLTTTAVSNITQTTASGGGTITSDGGFTVTARGVCWSTAPSPTIADSKTTNGAGIGSFTSNLAGLTANTPYYVRAYATNSAGTGYGDEVSFTTQTGSGGGSVTIGSQVWMDKNLDVATYRNGDPIPQVTDAATWAGLTTGAWCWYNNDPAMGAIYGKLYNWYAVNDPRGLAPAGWHVPSDAEWTTLTTYLGGDAVAGGKMKEGGYTHWSSPNAGADNSSGFTALPGGYRGINHGSFDGMGSFGHWWSSTEYSASGAWYRILGYYYAEVYRYYGNFGKSFGFSVRCVRD